MEIREVAPGEYERLVELTVQAYDSIPGYPRRPEYAAELRAVRSRAEQAVVLVAVEAGEILGGVTYVPRRGPWAEFEDGDAAGVRMLAVRVGAQRRGVGTALMQACIERARADGRRRIVLHSTQHMVAAHRLYEELGFRRTPERDWTPAPEIELRGYEIVV